MGYYQDDPHALSKRAKLFGHLDKSDANGIYCGLSRVTTSSDFSDPNQLNRQTTMLFSSQSQCSQGTTSLLTIFVSSIRPLQRMLAVSTRESSLSRWFRVPMNPIPP